MKKFALLLALPLIAFACGGTPDGPPADPAVIAAGKASFIANTCASCHGETGNADTPVGMALKPTPRAFSDADWQDSVTDAHIKKVILEGGAANGLNALMVSFKTNFENKDAELDSVVAFIRSLKK
ncbi:MAG: mono/diheme cytochrome c family protein [Bacteroidia bacterium]|jgi:mono/diheme cytochrome c family protein